MGGNQTGTAKMQSHFVSASGQVLALFKVYNRRKLLGINNFGTCNCGHLGDNEALK